MNYIIAIDQSTSSTKAMLFDEQCRMLERANVDHHQYYPQTGWVEHDAEEIYQNMVEAIRILLEERGKRNKEERGERRERTLSASRIKEKRWSCGTV
jgi:glycerol kinase